MFAKFKELREEREGGFTLIELLVVILIIGILAAIAIPMFLNQRKSAVDSAVQSDVKNAATQVETWMVKNPSVAITDETVSATQAGTASLKDAKVSAGTTIKIKAGTELGTYIICGTNSGGDQSKDTESAVKYDSANGGLTSGVACS